MCGITSSLHQEQQQQQQQQQQKPIRRSHPTRPHERGLCHSHSLWLLLLQAANLNTIPG
jgi:hypothetical protein